MADAKVIIKGENKLSSPIKGAKQDLNSFSEIAKKAGDTLKKALGVTTAVVALKKLGDACAACFNEFSTANRAYKQLALSLKDSKGFDSVVKNIGILSRQTLEGKAGIEAMASELAALGKSSDEINHISDAAVYLSNVTGKDLNSSMTTLLNTYRGTTTQLNKLGIDTSNLTKEELANGAAVDLVVSKFKDLSEAMAEADTQQHITNIKNTIGDIKQQIGGILDYNFGPIIANIDNILTTSYDNVISVVNYIGAVIKNFREVLKNTITLIGAMIQRMWSWDFIKGTVTNTVNNIITLISGIFTALEKATGGFFSWSYHYIMSDIYDILAMIPRAFENLFENIVNGVVDSPLGRLLKWNEVSFDFGSYGLKEKGRIHFSKSLKAKQDMDIKGAIGTLSDTLTSVTSNMKEYLNEQFGDLFTEYGISIDTIVEPALKEIEIAANVTSQKVEEGTKEVVDTVEDIKKTFLDKFADNLALKLDKFLGTGDGKTPSESSGSFISKGLGYFTDSLGEAGDVVNELATNMATMGPLLGAIITALKYVFEGFGEVIGEVLNMATKMILEPLKEIGRVIGELVIPLIEMVMPLIADTANFLIGIFDSLRVVLMPVIQVISAVLTPVLSIISNVLQALMPVFKVFAKVVVTITGTIQYVIQVLQHWVASICNWLAGINLLGWRPFKGLAMEDPGSPGSYGSFIKNKWSEVDAAFEPTYTGTDIGTSTAVQNASYSGGTNVTINIYQEAPVVGDGGMEQFAIMLRQQFADLDYVGR